MNGRTIAMALVALLSSSLAFAADGVSDPFPDPASDPPGTVKLQPNGGVWLDKPNGRVIVMGKVCLRQGQLEMFACPTKSKEHESVLAVPVKPNVIHAALVALGTKPGRPVQFQPTYRAAEGPIVDVHLFWTDAAGKRRTARAQEWIRDVKTGKAMTDEFVFAGSSFIVNENDGKREYLADWGEFICVSNFSAAMLDVPVPSSDQNASLLFEAKTDAIPPLETAVAIVLVPRKPAAEKK
jgi:hypothetical protein